MSGDPFGFSNKQRIDRIASIPFGVNGISPLVSTSMIDAAAERHGFVSRAGDSEVATRRKSVGPTAALNVRCPVRVFNPFVEFCEKERLSYWEGIEKLMQIAGKL